MKSTIINKESNYSLHNLENYKKELNADVNEIIQKYFNLLVEYYKFIIENIKIKNKHYSKFIIIRGLDTITHVFLSLLLFTKNINTTYFNCQKAFYFYVEFVSQISEDENKFLQLTSRDASTYVYKKTIFEINNEFKKMNEDMTSNTRDIFEIINISTSLCKKYLLKVIENEDFSKNEELINLVQQIFSKLNYETVKIDKLKLYQELTDKILNSSDNNTIHLFEINKCIAKKFTKNNNIFNNCKNKILSEDFMDKINNDTSVNFVNWLIVK